MLSITLTAVHQQSTIPTVTIYVSAGGSDSNGDGTTSATAYASIDRAAPVLRYLQSLPAAFTIIMPMHQEATTIKAAAVYVFTTVHYKLHPAP